jgi:hypothetical protein
MKNMESCELYFTYIVAGALTDISAIGGVRAQLDYYIRWAA